MVKGQAAFGKFYSHTGRIRGVGTKFAHVDYDTMLADTKEAWVASDGQRFSKTDGMPLKIPEPVLALDLTTITKMEQT